MEQLPVKPCVKKCGSRHIDVIVLELKLFPLSRYNHTTIQYPQWNLRSDKTAYVFKRVLCHRFRALLSSGGHGKLLTSVPCGCYVYEHCGLMLCFQWWKYYIEWLNKTVCKNHVSVCLQFSFSEQNPEKQDFRRMRVRTSIIKKRKG